MGLFNPYDEYTQEDPLWRRTLGYILDTAGLGLGLLAPLGLVVIWFGGFVHGDRFLQVMCWSCGSLLLVGILGIIATFFVEVTIFRNREDSPEWLARGYLSCFTCLGLGFLLGVASIVYFGFNATSILH